MRARPSLLWGLSQVQQGGDRTPHLPWCHAGLRVPDKAREPPSQLCPLPNIDFSPCCSPRCRLSFGRFPLKVAGCLFPTGRWNLTQGRARSWRWRVAWSTAMKQMCGFAPLLPPTSFPSKLLKNSWVDTVLYVKCSYLQNHWNSGPLVISAPGHISLHREFSLD